MDIVVSADNQLVSVGDMVYIVSLNTKNFNYEVNSRVVAKILSHKKILYTRPDEDGYIGANMDIVFVDKSKAEEKARQFNA